MDFLYFLEGLRNPVTDALMSAVTYLGDETAFLAAALLVFWCVDKNRGYLILSVGFVGTIINQFLKLTFRIPRPWVLDENFTIVESARDAATGYSFPSGHTQNAVGTFGSIGITSRRLWVKILCGAAVLLIPFSRMYLGVHTPLDVGVSFVIASVLIALFLPLMNYFKKKPDAMNYLFWSMLALAIVYLLFVELYDFPADVDVLNLASGRKNAYSLLGSVAGICVAYPIDRKYINFDTRAVFWAQILKLGMGLGITVGLKAGLKMIFTMMFGADAMFPHAIRYALIVIFAAVIWPMTFRVFARLGKKDASAQSVGSNR